MMSCLRFGSRRSAQARGQGLVEFALITPLLLLFILGVIEVGRLLAIYSGVSSSAQQTARYGAVAGDNGAGTVFYLDCAGMRATARRTAFLQGLSENDIQIAYDTGFITDTIGACGADNVPRLAATGVQMTSANSGQLVNSGRVVISVTTTYQPLVPIVPIPRMAMNFVAARTIFTSIVGPTSTPQPPPDLELAMADNPDPVAPGSPLTYTLNVTNTGPAIATSITVVDQLPAGPTYGSASGSGWNCARVQAVVTCTVASLAAGPAPAINILMTSPASGTFTNTATVTSGRGDPNTSNNSASAQTTVATTADLGIVQTDVPDPVAPSGVFTYTLAVVNSGAVTANSVTVTDQLPGSVVLVSISGSGWTCNTSGALVTCTRASLPVGAAPNITLVVRAPVSTGMLTATANVTSATNDPNPGNNTSTAQTSVTAEADLAVTQADTPDPVGLNLPVTYTLQVTNNGPTTASSVSLMDTLPAGTTFVSASGAGWTCTRSGNVVTCTLPSLAASSTTTVTVNVNAPGSGGALSNYVSVASSTNDSNTGNNTATETTTVLACNPNVVSAADSWVTASPAQVQADGTQTAGVLVTLKDSCGNFLANRSVSLASSRGVADTITPSSGTTNANGQFTFLVKSAMMSPFSGGAFTPSTFTATSGSVTINQTGSVAFVCVTGALAPFSGSQDLKFSFTNNTGINRRLVSVTLTWPDGGSRKLTSLNFGTDQIWSGNGNNSPVTLDAGWTAGNRSLNTAANKTLQLNFNFPLTGTGQYQVTTQWDDTAGGSLCTAPTVTVTR